MAKIGIYYEGNEGVLYQKEGESTFIWEPEDFENQELKEFTSETEAMEFLQTVIKVEE